MRRVSKHNNQMLDILNARRYRIYGVFDFLEKKLINVSIDQEYLELEYDLAGYDEERFKVVSFDVFLY